MARTDNLSNFLTDVADAIREKTGKEESILASDFDTEIGSIEGGKSVLHPDAQLTFKNNATITNTEEAIGNLDLSQLKSTYQMFYGCSKLTTISDIDLPAVEIATEMFSNCSNLRTVPDNIRINMPNIEAAERMFYSCSNLRTVPLFDTSKVTNMRGMFGLTKISSLPLFDTSSCTNFIGIVQNCTSLLSIPQFDTSKATTVYQMMSACSNLTDVPVFDLSSVNTTSGLQFMCSSCRNLTDESLNNIMASLLTATNYPGTKTLTTIGLNATQKTRCHDLSNYQSLLDAGWTD